MELKNQYIQEISACDAYFKRSSFTLFCFNLHTMMNCIISATSISIKLTVFFFNI